MSGPALPIAKTITGLLRQFPATNVLFNTAGTSPNRTGPEAMNACNYYSPNPG
jgi:hypothetical protein